MFLTSHLSSSCFALVVEKVLLARLSWRKLMTITVTHWTIRIAVLWGENGSVSHPMLFLCLRTEGPLTSLLDLSNSRQTGHQPLFTHLLLRAEHVHPTLNSYVGVLTSSTSECGCVFFFFNLFWLHCLAHGILVPQPGMEPASPALGAQSLNRWTTGGP